MDKKFNIGIIGTSEIAFRRFLPALISQKKFNYIGIASRNIDKTKKFIETFGGIGYASYDEILNDDTVDAIYIPLPPAMHYEWAKKSLEKNKHVFLEKPFTTNFNDTKELINTAKKRNLALHENYMFQYHSQIEYIKSLINSNKIGDIRLIRINFGFPFRGNNDFRYTKELGGGALFDCGGYTLKLARLFLGDSTKIITSTLNYKKSFEVDIYGSATLVNDDGLVAQVSFGMDNSYKCDIEIWGSSGTIFTNRILTAPNGYNPIITIKEGNEEFQEVIDSDDTFGKSIRVFYESMINKDTRYMNYSEIEKQSKVVQNFVNEESK